MRVLRPTAAEAVYVLVVAGLAAAGLLSGTPWPYLVAAALTLPAGVVAVPAYYVGYGLLALVPGADPSSSSGSGSSDAAGHVVEQVSGGTAPWFGPATVTLGVLLLVAAAVVDVLFVRRLRARRRPLPTV